MNKIAALSAGSCESAQVISACNIAMSILLLEDRESLEGPSRPHTPAKGKLRRTGIFYVTRTRARPSRHLPCWAVWRRARVRVN